MRIERFEATPLSVPLIEPFVIASGRIACTRAALVRVTLVDESRDVRAEGLGEAAALPPVTAEDQPQLLAQLGDAAAQLVGATFDDLDALTAMLDGCFGNASVSRAGAECALLDAWSRTANVPMCTFLTGQQPRCLVTDITVPIGDPRHMANLAAAWSAQGFDTFKVKIGKSIDDDISALTLIAERVERARFRLDANAAFSVDEALRVLEACQRASLAVECFEQPCARGDLVGMAKVTAATTIPVVADESVCTLVDFERVIEARAASGVNLKLVKSGGLLAALAIGQRAREVGMPIMCGAMVETRLGMSAMGHVACALGGVDFPDLDTAFLLAGDPFEGGYQAQGAALTFLSEVGLGVSLKG